MDEPEQQQPLLHRLGWMALIWLASILALGTVALMIKWWLAP